MEKHWWIQQFGKSVGSFLFARNSQKVLFSRNACPDSCSRPCCTGKFPQITVNLFEILALAALADETTTEFFGQSVSLGVDAVWRDGMFPVPNTWQLSWKLNRPCRFLQQGRCTVHDEKPFACRNFPEMFFAAGHRGGAETYDLRLRLTTRSFICATDDNRSSSSVVGGLFPQVNRIMAIDAAISDLFFFGRTPFQIDVSGYLAVILKLGTKAEDDDLLVGRDHTQALGLAGGKKQVFASAVRKFMSERFEPKLRDNAFALLSGLEKPGALEQLFSGKIREWQSQFMREFDPRVLYSLTRER